jgi:NDP-sugar pyrophosphorylase family protein
MKPTLVIMAAGMASRYGSLKQIKKFGPKGETLIDYSVFDAYRAGFKDFIFIIRKATEKDFLELFKDRYPSDINIQYVFQELDKLPKGTPPIKGREKPWGTGHAILMAKEKLNGPFAVINADDFYGCESFISMYEYLKQNPTNFSMIGYRIENTLSDHGPVSRGVCELDESGHLLSIVERKKIIRNDKGQIDAEGFIINEGATVSLNFWGFNMELFPHLEKGFVEFLEKSKDDLKAEYLIPEVVGNLVSKGLFTVAVLPGSLNWFGVTYKEDDQEVRENLIKLQNEGFYPQELWNLIKS